MTPIRLRTRKTQGLLSPLHLHSCCLVLKCGYIRGSLKEQQVPEDLEKDEGKRMLCIVRGRLLFSSEEPKNVTSL